jgi:hypothetical protein
MHILIGIGVLAGLIAFAFGSGAARIFVGAVLLAIVAFFAIVAAMVIWPEGPPGSPNYKAAHQLHEKAQDNTSLVHAAERHFSRQAADGTVTWLPGDPLLDNVTRRACMAYYAEKYGESTNAVDTAMEECGK